MCTETFLRLPEEKRNRFLEAAWEEFTSVSLAEASINKIVQRARIPRGSFYQYFADKDALFDYLKNSVMEYLVGEYCEVMRKAGGDLFRTQLMCFDLVAGEAAVMDLPFARCIRIVRLNPALLPQVVMEGKLMETILMGIRELVNTEGLRSREAEFVAQTFGFTLVALAGAVIAQLEAPDRVEEHRRGLETQLDIIKYGSLAELCQVHG